MLLASRPFWPTSFYPHGQDPFHYWIRLVYYDVVMSTLDCARVACIYIYVVLSNKCQMNWETTTVYSVNHISSASEWRTQSLAYLELAAIFIPSNLYSGMTYFITPPSKRWPQTNPYQLCQWHSLPHLSLFAHILMLMPFYTIYF